MQKTAAAPVATWGVLVSKTTSAASYKKVDILPLYNKKLTHWDFIMF